MSTTPATIGQDASVGLPDGRLVAYVRLGDPDGRPVLVLHGTPASRLGFDFLHGPATALGLQVLCPDRPGIGGSSPSPMPSVAAYVADLIAFADALELGLVTVLGYSGGGPYALAAAATGGDRVTAAATMAGVASLDWPGAEEGLDKIDLRLARWTSTHPRRARTLLRALSLVTRRAPGIAAKSFVKSLSESDRKAVAAMPPDGGAGLAFVTEAFRQGVDGVFDDYLRLDRPWGFDPSATMVPVHVWQGDDDSLVPMAHAEHLVATTPGAEPHRLAVRGPRLHPGARGRHPGVAHAELTLSNERRGKRRGGHAEPFSRRRSTAASRPS